jgi:xylulokinase
MLADVYDCPVLVSKNREGPALGAAILAGVGTGVYPGVSEACAKILAIEERQTPISENTQAYQPYYELYRRLYPALKEQFATLSKL